MQSSPVNSIQIKALKTRQAGVFEIQLGGGSNQPAANTNIIGEASVVIGEKKYSGYYRISTDPKRQLRMSLQSFNQKIDEYRFISGYDMLYFEFASAASFDNPWLIGKITNVSATQKLTRNGGQNNGGQNDENQDSENQEDGGQNNENEHPPIIVSGKMSNPTGGSLARHFRAGDSNLVLDVGGNQRLSSVTPEDTLSGMSLKQGSYDQAKER